jgi:hypothetical protein
MNTPTDHERLLKRLDSQRRGLRRTVKLFARQLDQHLKNLSELATKTPQSKRVKNATRRLAEHEADRLLKELNQ